MGDRHYEDMVSLLCEEDNVWESVQHTAPVGFALFPDGESQRIFSYVCQTRIHGSNESHAQARLTSFVPLRGGHEFLFRLREKEQLGHDVLSV
jgi:hypothetical protein